MRPYRLIGNVGNVGDLRRAFLLDSANPGSPHSKVDIFGWNPVARILTDPDGVTWTKCGDAEWHRLPAGVSPLSALRTLMLPASTDGSYPGIVGCLGYDLRLHLEEFTSHSHSDLPVPRLDMALYDTIGLYDVEKRRYRFMAIDTPWSSSSPVKRVVAMKETVEGALAGLSCEPDGDAFTAVVESDVFGEPPLEGPVSDRSRAAYLEQVLEVRERIAAGDVYQVNLSQRLRTGAPADLSGAYRGLRRLGGGPYSAYIELEALPGASIDEGLTLLSSSPELFLELKEGAVLTRPIKGTRPRAIDPIMDVTLREDLISSAKERAENVMIVDVLRNDLGRVCMPGTVHAGRLCEVESFSYVHHLVSEVSGVLNDGLDACDLIAATFPCGSVTGAPKIRAMELIDELESLSRGIYTGSIGWISVDGRSCALNVAIRTITAHDGTAYMNVGGGIVWDSSPDDEYEETLHKARVMRQAMLGAANEDTSGSPSVSPFRAPSGAAYETSSSNARPPRTAH